MIRQYEHKDIQDMIRIWNEVVEEGIAFPQEELLTEETGSSFFASQSYTAVAEIDGKVKGLYILHPNNVGRCGHICNASYAVSSDARGQCPLEVSRRIAFRPSGGDGIPEHA